MPRHRLLLALPLLLAAVPGCVLPDPLAVARVAVDPGAALRDAGRMALGRELSGLMSPRELDTVAASERMVADLRRIAADNPGAATSGELGSIADRLETRLAAQRATESAAVPAGLLARPEVAHPWVVDELPGHGPRDRFPSVHRLSADAGSRRILGMKQRLLDGGSLGVVGRHGLIGEQRIGPTVRPGYAAGGWGEEPPPDSLLSSPPPP